MGKPIGIRIDEPNIPGKDEIKQLPRWAQVAFAARCARRIQSLFAPSWQDAPQKHVDAIEHAINTAENASVGTVRLGDAATSNAARKAASQATNARDAAKTSNNDVIAANIAAAAANAATSAYSDDIIYVFNCIDAIDTVGHSIRNKKEQSKIIAGIRRDYNTLIQQAKEKKWNDENPIGPEVFGPMWPEGEPDWEKIAQEQMNQSETKKQTKKEFKRSKGVGYDDAAIENLSVDTTPHFNLSRIIFSGNTLFTDEQLLENIPEIFNASKEGGTDTTAFYDLKPIKAIAAEPGTEVKVSARTIQGFTQYILSLYQNKEYVGIYVYIPSEAFEPNGDLSQGVLPVHILEAVDFELEQEFRDFLINNKKVPESTIDPNQGGYRIEQKLVTFLSISGENNKNVVIIAFLPPVDNEGISNSNEKVQQYLADSNQKNNSAYIVCPAKYNKDYPFDIYQVTDTDKPDSISYEDFPTYNQMLFEDRLSGAGRRIYRALIELAKEQHQLSINAVCKDYINLQIKKNNRTAAQIHRLKDSDDNIALVLAGYQSVFPNPKGEIYVSRGELNQLSGNVRYYPKEIAWLNGNVNHERLRFRAGVYILIPGSLVLEDVENEVQGLLDLAIKNAEAQSDIDVPEPKKGTGTIPTMASDKPGVEDLLGRERLAQSLAKMFVHTESIEGLTVALLGDWGEGKSTVMELVKKELKKEPFEFAMFNAWEYEHTDNIAAGLAQEVINGLCNKLSFWERCKAIAKFAWHEYKGEIVNILIYSLVAMIIFISVVSFVQSSIFKDILLSGGVIALISYLFTKIAWFIEHPLGKKIGAYLRLPGYGKHLGLIPVIKKHLGTLCKQHLDDKKLLVFVDDLDRCQPECISKTLDAIRLVMSIPNVIVMIGIDHRIAFKAVEKTYVELGDDDGRNEADIARDYLGKIILLPVRLMATGQTELKEYINKKLYPDAEESISEQKENSVKTVVPKTIPTFYGEDENLDDVTPEIPKTENLGFPETPSSSQPTKDKTDEEIEEAMRETIEERDRFYDLAVKFKFTNPRQLLRLRNCYRLLKALNSQKEYQIEDLLPMIFWQEFLHAQRREVRNRCMVALKDNSHIDKIEDRDIKQIVNDVRDEIADLFQPDGKYAEISKFVRCVILPHSEEGVFDTLEEIEEWIKRQKDDIPKKAKTPCPLGLKIV